MFFYIYLTLILLFYQFFYANIRKIFEMEKLNTKKIKKSHIISESQ